MEEGKKLTFSDIFCELRKVEIRDRLVQKNTGKTMLDYLPWATAFDEVAKRYDTDYEFCMFDNDKDGIKESPYLITETGLMVQTTVTVEGFTRIMQLPVMDSNNRSMKLEEWSGKTKNGEFTVSAAKMTDINKASMRCLTKNIAMFGLGLSLWTKDEIPNAIATLMKLAADCKKLIADKFKAAEEAGDKATSEKIAELCKTTLPEECNGDPTLCEDEETLKTLKKQLMAVRVAKKAR